MYTKGRAPVTQRDDSVTNPIVMYTTKESPTRGDQRDLVHN